MFHLFDGDNWSKHATLELAQKGAEAALETAVYACDPEWPDWVNHIGVYEAPEECEAPDEDGKLVLVAHEINMQESPSDSGCDYYCEYALDAPA